MQERQVDVAIIGSGSAGLYAMSKVRPSGKSVVLINGGELLRQWVDDPEATPGDLEALAGKDEVAWMAEQETVLLQPGLRPILSPQTLILLEILFIYHLKHQVLINTLELIQHMRLHLEN